ncbi:UDP-Glycosyltransferase/glycogen phosphorylase [Punctularia strigosozonata HHB-11173 SS5]|uniref:UDP-Glycosyltransferase/glycogen phosphorylase n=1 Tax=Punctularia strigosozonata (strain HHB-11173) TaxID=741275 RepID=UPI00044186DE|nr:UDP-Glycosyltransferase/glycogen phosphorylase [Punctularia strigosozonata HHB-11173 SS5]EIN06342.1 UDP-Glycosyltransferase/glycogen phosphorylase [Punctularia strigosozonata HHB-11173 SS5]
MAQDSHNQGHLLIHPFGGWGHIKPQCNFAARIAKAKNTGVTFLISPTYYNKTQQELSRHFESGDERSKLIRLIGLREDVTVSSIERGDPVFAEVYTSIVETGSLTCSVSKTVFDGLSQPDTAIVDFYGYGPLQVIRSASRTPVKVLVWNGGALSFILRVFGPITEKGIDHWQEMVGTKAAVTGMDFVEAANDILTGDHGTIVEVPGMPKMYDWEFFPQPLPPYPMGLVAIQILLRACDGVIHITAEEYEPVYAAAFDKWLGPERKSYVLGPLLADSKGEAAKAGELVQSAKAKEIQEFLNKNLDTHGVRSVLYVSFGSTSWPAEPEKLWAFLDVAMELNIPFILSHNSPQAVIPPDFVTKAETSGLGILSKWSPQQVILDHEATGWFLSHCGHNSCLESLSSGVPIIGWPYAIDHVTGAVHVSTVLNVGYELLEVRSGTMGLKTVYRTGIAPEGTVDAVRREAREVLQLAKGRDGEAKRQNALKLKAKLAEAWTEHGPAFKAFQQLLADLSAA